MLSAHEAKEKRRLATNWLPRYTGMVPSGFGKYILLTNFHSYLEEFAAGERVDIQGVGKPMQAATSNGVTMVNFGIGAPNAALICDLLAVVPDIRALVFLGKCGGLQDLESNGRTIAIGDYILPTAAIRGEGTSDSYYPKEVPALPSFQVQLNISPFVLAHDKNCHAGMVYSTNRRLWEHDGSFRSYLQELRCVGIDMETAAFYTAAFANHIPHGALLLVSDMPLIEAKTQASDAVVTSQHAMTHLTIGMEAIRSMEQKGESLRYLSFKKHETPTCNADLPSV